MFVDTATVTIQAGKGGDGAVSFRHEIYVDKGGPDGGDGGKGGDVIFVATEQLNTLLNFRYQPRLAADNGRNGDKRKKAGRSGQPLYVKVPVGTIVRKDGQVIADLGFPNAGKSTFLSVVSNARPEIADYAFTTLTPNLGVADIDDSHLLIADIPGLIEGASEGKGLGDAFLRHVQRTAVLLHLIDAYDDDVAGKYLTIRRELTKYNPELAKRPEVVALTKCEGLDDELIAMQKDALTLAAAKGTPIFAISSTAHKGITEVLRALRRSVTEARAAEAVEAEELDDDTPTITLSADALSKHWEVRYDEQEGVYHVSGEKIEKFARRTNYDNFESLNRLRDIMHRMGISHELSRQGASGESIVQVGDSTPFTLVEQ